MTAVLFLLFFIVGGTPLRAQARAEVREWKKSFGTVPKGEVVKLHYTINNTGDQPLLIHDAEVACSCTSVDYPAQPLRPGQSGAVTVTFNTKTVYERQDRIVYLHSNDPRSPLKLRFKGFVQKTPEAGKK